MGHLSAPELDSAEERRRERLAAYAILDTKRETLYDRLVFTAAQMLRVPFATIALFDDHRQWFKAQVGLNLQQVPRETAFCELMPTSDGVIAIEDVSRDSRFADNPLVIGPPYIRFYAGAPLITPDGIQVGTLCVGDRVAKSMTARQILQLTQLAASVVVVLESRRTTVSVV